ncbi:MAG: sulfatase [Candidatus Hydrogenedentes bacterium]|nr:sulfatase [Candidatus Hydrogenedentota bacterium]
MMRITSIVPLLILLACGLIPLGSGCGGETAPSTETASARPSPDSASNDAPQPARDWTNVLLISVDTMRADHLSCYGYKHKTSPYIDTIATEGAIYERVYAPKSSTWPALATLHTSLYPVTHGVRNNGLRLDNTPDTLAEVLSGEGYTCGAILTNAAAQNWEGFSYKEGVREEPADKIATVTARTWLREKQDEKFFLWVHYIAPHSPWAPPEKHRLFGDPTYSGTLTGGQDDMAAAMLSEQGINDADLAHIISLYDGEINLTDMMIGILMESLRELGLDQNTLVVITADHGEELYEHYRFLHHQASVYEGTLRVPLIYRLPGKIPAGKSVPDLCGLIDVAPTILGILDVPVPASYQGVNTEPLMRGETVALGPAFGEWRDKILFVRTNEYRYIYNPLNYHPPMVNNQRLAGLTDAELAKRNGMPIKEQELYKVSEDPYEQKEIAADNEEAITALRALLDGYMSQYSWKFNDATDNRMKQEIDPQTRQELENLGYVM